VTKVDATLTKVRTLLIWLSSSNFPGRPGTKWWGGGCRTRYRQRPL